MGGLDNAYKKSAKGRFSPSNPGKYAGDLSNLVYRSKLELDAFRWFDRHPSVISWSSETYRVPYYYKKPRTYIVDIWCRMRLANGDIQQYLIEIKPSGKIRPPAPRKRRSKYYDALVEEYNMNQAKWDAAKKYAFNNGMVFKVLTEKVIQ